MTGASEERQDEQPLRFSMKALLIVVTTVCLVSAAVVMFVPPNLRLIVWFTLMIQVPVIWWSIRQGDRGQARIKALIESREAITVKIDPKWRRRVHSPWFYLITAFTGVSVSFAPMALFWCGATPELGLWRWVIGAASFLMIYLVPGFYMSLAGEVLAQLYQQKLSEEEVATSLETGRVK